jgi:hypothetical protein
MSDRPKTRSETPPETPPETLPETLAPLVEAMRADVLGPAAVADVARRVEAATRTLPHGPGTTGTAGTTLTGAKALGLGALAILGGAALIVAAIRGFGDDDSAPARATPAHGAPTIAPASPPAPSRADAPATIPSTTSAPTTPTPIAVGPGARDEGSSVDAARSAGSMDARVAPRPARSRDDVRHASPGPHGPRLDPSADADAEHVLLVEARRTLPGDPARALALANQHAARFAAGMLAPEREMIAVDALEALGRREVAARRAATLVARWPGSSYARRVKARGLVP